MTVLDASYKLIFASISDNEKLIKEWLTILASLSFILVDETR